MIYEWNNNVYKYYEKEELIIPYYVKSEIETIWLYYLSFCIKTKQYYKSKNLLKKNIQSMIYSNNPVIYKNYKIEFDSNNIKISIIHEINFKNFLIKECSITADDKHLEFIENHINAKNNMTKEKIKKYINYYNISSYMYTKSILKILLKLMIIWK